MRGTRLTFALVLEIKKALWNGEKQTNVANRLTVSQSSVSRIERGLAWYEVPWPDGSVGKFSASLARLAHKQLEEQITGKHEVPLEKHGIDPFLFEQEVQRLEQEELLKAVLVNDDEPPMAQEQENEVALILPQYDEEKWNVVVHLAGEIKLVQRALNTKDLSLRTAITEVFANLPSGSWNEPVAERLVMQIKEQIDRNN